MIGVAAAAASQSVAAVGLSGFEDPHDDPHAKRRKRCAEEQGACKKCNEIDRIFQSMRVLRNRHAYMHEPMMARMNALIEPGQVQCPVRPVEDRLVDNGVDE